MEAKVSGTDKKNDRFYVPYGGEVTLFEVDDKSSGIPLEVSKTWNGEKNIWQAASVGDLLALQSFLSNGVNVDVTDDEGYTPLMSAACRGQVGAMKMMLDNGAKLDESNLYGLTPLMSASANGYVQAVKLLLERGADVNAKSSLIVNSTEDSALTIAIREKRAGIIKLLKEAGAKH
jgi:ankyrin repeat protein